MDISGAKNVFNDKNANTKRIIDRHLAESFDSRAVWLTGFGRQTPNQATWVRSPRRASYCSGSRPNVFLLLFTRLNVHTIVVHDSFCCSVVSVEQEQQKNGRTFRCSSGKRCYLGVVQWWTGSGSSPRYYHYQHRIGTRQASLSALGSIGPND